MAQHLLIVGQVEHIGEVSSETNLYDGNENGSQMRAALRQVTGTGTAHMTACQLSCVISVTCVIMTNGSCGSFSTAAGHAQH